MSSDRAIVVEKGCSSKLVFLGRNSRAEACRPVSLLSIRLAEV